MTQTAADIRFSTPLEAEDRFNGARRTGAAAPSAIGEEPTTLSAVARMQEQQHSPATTLDIGPGPDPSPKKSVGSIWSRVVNAAIVVEEHLAEWFGLNQSKYQWAVDEYMDRQLAGQPPVTPASSTAPVELQTQPMSQQAMHRNANEVDNV